MTSRPTRGRVLLAVLANFFAVAAAVVVSTLAPRALPLGEARAQLASSVIVVGVHTTLLLLALRLTKLDRRDAGVAIRRGDLRGAAAGAALAIVVIAATIGLAGVFGGVRLSLAPRADWPTKSMFASSLLGTFVRAAFEEIAFRAGLVGILGLAFRRGIALGVPAVLFGLAHAGNQGASAISVVNTTIAAILLAGLFLLGSPGEDGAPSRPSLASCTAFHATWNFTIGTVLGIAVSGGAGSMHIFTVVVKSPTWSGGTYGIEASPATAVVYGAAAVLVLHRLMQRISPNTAGAQG